MHAAPCMCVCFFFFFSFSLRAGDDRLVQVVDCAAAMDSQGSSSVTPLQTVNMLMHTFPRFRHKFSLLPPYSHKHNYRQISSLLLLLLTSFMPKPMVPELSMAPFSEGKMHTFLFNNFSLAGCGQRIAPLPRNIRYELQAAV